MKNRTSSARAARLALAALAVAGALLAPTSSRAQTLQVTAGAMPAGAAVAGATSGTVVGRLALTPTGTVTLSALSVSSTGTAVPGADLSSVALFDVTFVPTVFVGAGIWNPATSRWDFTNLAYNVSAPTTFAVVMNAAPGATVGRTFAMNLNVPADVTVASPATVSNSTTIAGSAFNLVAGTPGGSAAANAPMVAIVNPTTSGVVSGTFRVQLRVFNKVNNLGINGLAASSPVTISTDNGQTFAASGAVFAQAVTANTKYDAVYANDPTWVGTVTGRTYEAQLALPPGSYTLRARAQNQVPQTVTSEPVQITVAAAGKGDGKLLVRDNSSQLCGDCHAVQTHSSEAVGTKYGAWAASCRDCHAPHRTRNIHLVNEAIFPPSVAGTIYPATNVGYSSPAGASTTSGWDASRAKPTGTGSFANADNTGPCQVCHTRTQNPGTAAARWRRTGNADTHYTTAAGTASCSGCHSHTNGFKAGESGGGAACASCHGTIWNLMNGATPTVSKHQLGNVAGTNDSPTDSGQLWNPQALLTNVTPAQRSCTNMCHGDHPHDLTNPADSTHSYNLYLDPSNTTSRADGTATRTQANRANEDFDPTTNTGLCVKCHVQPIVTGGMTVSGSTFGASAHDFVTYAGTTWQYTLHNGVTQRNCTKCHASRTEGTTPNAGANGSGTVAVHGSTTDDHLLAGSNLGGTSPYVCYNCHGSAAPVNGAQGNRSSKPIQAQITKAHGHPVGSDTVHDTLAEQSGAAFGNTLGGKARHVNCLDCHDTHQTQAGKHTAQTNLAGPPLQGAWGAQFVSSIASWTAPVAANFTKKTITAGVDVEATLCFKCHSSFYGTLPTTPSGTFTETDTAKEFNPGNQGNYGGTWAAGKTAGSYHPVLASASGNLGVTGNITAPWTKTSLMTCSDCHASDATTDPNGPHGSAAAFMLKGPNTTWNNTIAVGSGGMPAGTFCANCHAAAFTGGRYTAHTNGHHNIACMNCHAAIPHGGPRPGFLNPAAGTNTTNLPAIAGWDNTAPYWQGGTSNRLYLVSYPSSQSASWQQSNCGCNGTGH